MCKIGILGGTFNPIHTAHIHLAQRWNKELLLDMLYMIPANIPPHKRPEYLANGQDRLEMCRLACKDDPCLRVSDIELRRTGSSFTIDTLQEIQTRHPQAQLYLLMGGDMFLYFPQWVRYEEIIKIATLCAVPRAEKQIVAMRQMQEQLAAKGAHIILLDAPVEEISSTTIRQQLIQEGTTHGLLNPEVERYILSKGIYALAH